MSNPSFQTYPCPSNPEHGPLIPPKDGKGAWLCPHHAHDGRPASHPLGAAPSVRSRFTLSEASSGHLAAPAAAAPLDTAALEIAPAAATPLDTAPLGTADAPRAGAVVPALVLTTVEIAPENITLEPSAGLVPFGPVPFALEPALLTGLADHE